MIVDLQPYTEFRDLLKELDWYAVEAPRPALRHVEWLFGPNDSLFRQDRDRSALTILHAVDGEDRETTFSGLRNPVSRLGHFRLLQYRRGLRIS